MGRRSKLTPELIADVRKLLSETGLFRRDVAARVGVCEQTFSLWFTQGQNDEPEYEPHRLFRQAVLEGEAECKERAHNLIFATAATNPKLALTLMARRWPEQYGRHDNVEDRSDQDKAADAQALRETLLERLGKLLPEAAAPAPSSDAS